jgi:chorismate mutase
MSEPVLAGDLSFEPYHTIDYFASQGIKLRAEDLTKDKFGRQLKSFTEWLRTMKKVGPVTADSNSTPAIDETIVKKAEASVENNDVETEAMAEVWAKQGKMSKAIEIYQKLSLLNPSKSHYFAAKIEQLKA